MNRNLTIFIFLLIALSKFSVSAQSSSVPANSNFFDNSKIIDINITLLQTNWAAQLDSLKASTSDDMLLGSIKIDGIQYDSVGIRYRGGNSFKFGSKRNPWQIKLNYIRSAQNHLGSKVLQISSALRDPSMVREVLSYEIARKYMFAPHANYVRVSVNNIYNGLYVNVENIDESFLDRNFGVANNALYKIYSADPKTIPDECHKNSYGSLENENNPACYLNFFRPLSSLPRWNELIEFINVLNKSPEQIEKVLDVDQTLWMLAFNNVLVNLSSYSGDKSINVYWYKNKFGQFTPIIWDLNLSFGSYKNTGSGSDLKLEQLQQLDPLLHLNEPSKPLASQLLKNPTYQKIYLSHLKAILNENFENNSYSKRTEELQKMIADAFYKDPNKTYKNEDLAKSMKQTIGETSKIPGLVELMEPRIKFLKKYPQLQYVPSRVRDINFASRDKYSSDTLKVFKLRAKIENFPKKVQVKYRFSNAEDFKTADLNDEGKDGDEKPNDKVFAAIIMPASPQNKEMEYYFMVENAATISFEPANYRQKLLKISLTELNK